METKLTILVIYVPNLPTSNAKPWENINISLTNKCWLPWPQIMLGDFNMVEDAIDHLPMHAERS